MLLRPEIYIVDDEPDVCRSLRILLSGEAFPVRTFASAEDLLSVINELPLGVVLTDVRLGGLDGYELLTALRRLDRHDPVIVMTGHADVPLAVKYIKAGASEFLEKPFEADTLIYAINQANTIKVPRKSVSPDITRHVADLSRREREVLCALVDGATNKAIATRLGISPRTVEIYRSNLMKKMEAETLSQLVRMAVEVGIAAS